MRESNFYGDEHGQRINIDNWQPQTGGFWQYYSLQDPGEREERPGRTSRPPSLPPGSTFLDTMQIEDVRRQETKYTLRKRL